MNPQAASKRKSRIKTGLLVLLVLLPLTIIFVVIPLSKVIGAERQTGVIQSVGLNEVYVKTNGSLETTVVETTCSRGCPTYKTSDTLTFYKKGNSGIILGSVLAPLIIGTLILLVLVFTSYRFIHSKPKFLP